MLNWRPLELATVGLLLFYASGGAAQTAPAEASATDALSISAWVTTAGPYGEMWDLNIAASGNIALKVYYSMSRTPGTVLGEFTLSDEARAKIVTSMSEAQFFALPKEISPEMVSLHQPDLRIQIWHGAKHHEVQLYSPGDIPDSAEAKRFMVVWKALFAGLPLQPSW